MVVSYKTYALRVEFLKYQNGQNCIRLYDISDGVLYATATTSVNYHLDKDEVAIKDYSENSGILQMLIENDIVEKPKRFVQSGFIKIPICVKGLSFQQKT